MNFGTKTVWRQILVWLIWFMVVLVFMQPANQAGYQPDSSRPLLGVVTHDSRQNGPLFPWQARYRWKKYALIKYRAWRRAYRRAKRVAALGRLALSGMMTMAQVVDWLTARQVRYQMGALPVLYALLETLKVRQVIKRHCPTQAEVDHGTVALVLLLFVSLFYCKGAKFRLRIACSGEGCSLVFPSLHATNKNLTGDTIMTNEITKNENSAERAKRTYAPHVDIFETNDNIVVLADMPGVDENSIDIMLEKNVLSINGRV